MERYAVASVTEIVPDRGRVFTLGNGVEIGLFAVAGGYRAYRNLCPHAGAPVCRGEVSRAAGTGGDQDLEILRCPWHAWEFDLATGACLGNPACRLEPFAVEIVGDQLFVSI